LGTASGSTGVLPRSARRAAAVAAAPATATPPTIAALPQWLLDFLADDFDFVVVFGLAAVFDFAAVFDLEVAFDLAVVALSAAGLRGVVGLLVVVTIGSSLFIERA
jgi:hypothetical protein